MTLSEYFADRPRGSKSDMAREIGISQTWLALLIAGTHVPSAEVCVDIEKYTNGAVTRKELRPDLFGDLR